MRTADSDNRLRQSPLWKQVVKAYSKLAVAQKSRDEVGWLKAWKQLTSLIEKNTPLEDLPLFKPPMCEARKELRRVFPDLAKTV